MSIAPALAPLRPAHTPGPPSTRWDRLRFDAAAEPRTSESGTSAGTAAESGPVPVASPRLVWSRGRAPERTDPQQWAGVLVRACAEALLGVRPAAQLSRWLDPAVWSALSRRSALAMDLRGRPRLPRPMTVRRVIGGAVTEAVWEGSVILDDGTRVRGVAVRLEDHRGRWRATALRIG